MAAVYSFPPGLASLLKLASLQLLSLTLAPLLAPAEAGQGWRGMGHFSELSPSHLPSVPWRAVLLPVSSNVHKENLQQNCSSLHAAG